MEGVKVEELFEDEDDENESAGSNAKEVDEIPMCAKCVIEVVGDGNDGKADEEHLIPMALERVEQFDGGLSKGRWEMIHKNLATSGTAGGQISSLKHAAEVDERRAPSPIYVSLHDPLGQPAFRHSPTKPIPSWMQYLPNQRSNTPMGDIEPRPASLLDDYFSPSESSVVGSDAEVSPPPPPVVPPYKVPLKSTLPTYTPVQMPRPFTFIAEEPVQRPSSSKLDPGLSPSSKHVHFNNDHNHQDYAATTAKAKTPSESSEFLDKYQHHSAAAASRSTKKERTGDVLLSPWSQRYSGTQYRMGSSDTDASLKWKPSTSITGATDRPLSAEQQTYLTVAIDGTGQKYKQQKGRFGHRDHTHASCKLSSGGSHAGAAGGGDGVSDFFVQQQRRRPVTLQDQLKKVFGFV